MAAEIVDLIYETAYELDDDPGKKTDQYRTIIQTSTIANEKAKILCLDVIKKHFKHYPELQDDALVGLESLMKISSAPVRLHAIGGLVAMAIDVPAYQERVSEILTSLLQSEEEIKPDATKALAKLIIASPEQCVQGIFKHIAATADSNTALSTVIGSLLSPDVVGLVGNMDVEKALFHHVEQIIPSLSTNQVAVLAKGLGRLRLFSEPRRRQLAELVIAPMKKSLLFDVTDEDSVKGYTASVHLAREYAKTGPLPALSTFTFNSVLPSLANASVNALQPLVVAIADVTERGVSDMVATSFPDFLSLLLTTLPNVPESQAAEDEPINFDLLEAMLFILHSFVAKDPSLFNEGETNKQLARPRLLYLGTKARTQVAKIDQTLSSAGGRGKEEVQELKLKRTVANNVVELVKDLLRPHLSGKSVTLSWLQSTAHSSAVKRTLRSEPITNAKGEHSKKIAKELYHPPREKYSAGLTRDRQVFKSAARGDQHDHRGAAQAP